MSTRIDVKSKKKIALVLSGGGIKAAAFHIGVCMALKEKGFKFAGGTKEQVTLKYPEESAMTIRLYVGSSAGAVISSTLASGYPVEALVHAFEVGVGSSDHPHFEDEGIPLFKPMSYSDIFHVNGLNLIRMLPGFFKRNALIQGGLEALIKSGFKLNGLFTTHGVEKYLKQHVLIENDFSRLGVELFVVGTQLNHSRKVIFGAFNESFKSNDKYFVNYAPISDAVAASTALPPVFAPYPIKKPDGKELYVFDGEIRDTLSTHVAADHDADLVISSYSVQPYHYNEEIGSLHDFGIPAIINQALYQVIQQKIDKHIEHQNNYRLIYEDIGEYLKKINLPDEHRKKILEIVAHRANYKPNVDYIYIHPKATNHEMFFVDHFSLNPEILSRIVRIGFKSTLATLRKHGI